MSLIELAYRNRQGRSALVSVLLLGACAGGPPPVSGGQASPLRAACDEFQALRARELGVPRTAVLQPLFPEKAAELFRRAEAFGYSGGFQFTREGRTILSQGYGMADRGRGIPIAPDSIFDIGSVTKQFTAAAILRLEEMGRLRTSDPISKHLPDVPADKKGITIHHLLTHSSGLEMESGPRSSRITRDEAVRIMLGTVLKSAPGERYGYSNTGYALLGAIIGRASGSSYEAFLRAQLWQPVGMRRTGMQLGGMDRAAVAESWFFDGTQPPNLARLPEHGGKPLWQGHGSGYVLSTMRDLERWGEALRTGRILSDESRRKLFRPHMREHGKNPFYYGYGWTISAARDGSCRIGHNGSGGLHYDYMTFLPERDALVIAFATLERTRWSKFADKAWPALFGAEPDLPPVARLPREALARLAGQYRLQSGALLPVRMEEERLYIDAVNGEVVRLFSPWPMLPPSQTAALGDRRAMMETVMEGISKGDYAPLFARVRAGTDLKEEKAWWDSNWPQWTAANGRYLGLDMVGTVSLPEDSGAAAPDRLRTLALLRFERGVVAVGFVHDPGGRVYVDWMPQYLDRRIYLAPQAGGGFMTYSIASKRTVRVRFEPQAGRPGQAVSIDNAQEQARAERVR
jgi:CubicO group peptidase (beta-lactamase class C family)